METLEIVTNESQFVQEASDDELLRYIEQSAFRSPDTETLLLNCRKRNIVKEYIERHGLKPSPAVQVFRSDDQALVYTLLHRCRDNRVIMKSFLSEGHYGTIWGYIQNNDVPELPEQEILKQDNREEMLNLVEQGKGSPFFNLSVIRTNDAYMISKLIDCNSNLSLREKREILYTARMENVDQLIVSQEKSDFKAVMRQIRLLRFGAEKEVDAFIKCNRFKREAWEYFAKKMPFEMVVSYVKHYQPKGGDVALINHPEPDGLVKYLSKCKRLSEEGEDLLLKKGNYRLIKAYIKMHRFSLANEKKFIERGHSNEIQCYLKWNGYVYPEHVGLLYTRAKRRELEQMSLNATEQGFLLDSNNGFRIDCYIKFHSFDAEYEGRFLAQYRLRLCEKYILAHKLSLEGMLAVLERGDEKLIELMLLLNVLPDEAFEVFEKMATPEQMKAYRSCIGDSSTPHAHYEAYLREVAGPLEDFDVCVGIVRS